MLCHLAAVTSNTRLSRRISCRCSSNATILAFPRLSFIFFLLGLAWLQYPNVVGAFVSSTSLHRKCKASFVDSSSHNKEARLSVVLTAATHAKVVSPINDAAPGQLGREDTGNDDIAAILARADPSLGAPLPPAFTTCPFNGILGGPRSFYRDASQALQSPSLFSFVSRNHKPMVEVSGGEHVRRLLRQEFSGNLTSNAVAGISQMVCGRQSLRTAQDKAEHKTLRALVGVPLSTKAVAASVPRLEAICRGRIDDMLAAAAAADVDGRDDGTTIKNGGRVVAAIDVTQAMALDVTWQQVLGLDLQTQQEIDDFHTKTYAWLRGAYCQPGSPELATTLKVREYLVQTIESKIERLKEAGCSDGSTVGGLVFATIEDGEEEDSEATRTDSILSETATKRTLSNAEVIDNALLLIFAATETTSSTLANVVLLMGLHPHVWQQVVTEQKQLVEKHGEALTAEILAHECMYLDAVLQETLRILPVTLVSKRETTNSIVIDGQQIPKGWGVSYNIFLTHQQDESIISSQDSSNTSMDLMLGFQPSRWLDPQTRPSNKEYIPFGAGPRKCPGITLAMTEMKTFLSIFARRVVDYELVLDVDLNKPIDEQIVWKQLNAVQLPEDGVQIRIRN